MDTMVATQEATMEVATLEQQLALPKQYSRSLTPAEVQQVRDLVASIDVHNREKIIAFGQEQQAQLGKFSDSILQGAGTKEVGEAGDILTQVIGQINGYQADCNADNKGLFAFLKKQKNKLETLRTKYKKVTDNVETVVSDLKSKELALKGVSRNFDGMFNENMETIKFLTMAIFAGEQALNQEKRNFERVKKEAEESGDLTKIQEVSDFNDDLVRFERRLYDLKVTRMLAIQQGPQIRNIQKGADQVAESIRSTIFTAIPMWKSQMAIALGMQTVRKGADALNAVRDATNAMLIQNSMLNKQMTLEVAQTTERPVVDIETVTTVNNNLIEALNGSFDIAQKAINDRKEGTQKLQETETQLRNAISQFKSVY